MKIIVKNNSYYNFELYFVANRFLEIFLTIYSILNFSLMEEKL